MPESSQLQSRYNFMLSSKRQQHNTTNLFVWGSDSHGQLGLPHSGNTSHNLPKPLTMLHSIKTLSCGQKHMAFVTHEGQVYTQGCNADGKLGVGQSTKWSNIPMKVNLPGAATKVQCGMAHTLCLLESGEAYAWGNNEKGQLGTADYKNKPKPAKVQIERVRQISAGATHSGFLTQAGEVFMCGGNESGELGIPRKDKVNAPALLQMRTKFADVSCGIFYTLLLDESGLVYATGSNKYGQLGNNSKSPESIPTLLKSLQAEHIVKICTGYHSGALTDKGELYLWGSGTFGQLFKPTKIKKPYPFIDLSIGGFFGCAVDSKHNVYSWGNNGSGELGMGHFENCKELTEVVFLRGKNVERVYCGVNFAFAVVGGQTASTGGTVPIRGNSQQSHYFRADNSGNTDRLERHSNSTFSHNQYAQHSANTSVRQLKSTIQELQQSERTLLSQRQSLQSKLQLLSKDYEKLCNKYDMIEIIVGEKQKIISIYESKIKEMSKSTDEYSVQNRLLKQQIKRMNETIERNAQMYADKMRQKDDIIIRMERGQADLIQEMGIMKGELKLSENLLKDRLEEDRMRQGKIDRSYDEALRLKDRRIVELQAENKALSSELQKWTSDKFRREENIKNTSGRIEALLRSKQQDQIDYIKKINKLECMLQDRDEQIAMMRRGGLSYVQPATVPPVPVFAPPPIPSIIRPIPVPQSRLDRSVESSLANNAYIRQLTDELRQKDELIVQLRRDLASSPVLGLQTQRFPLAESLRLENQQLRDIIDNLRKYPPVELQSKLTSSLHRQIDLSSKLRAEIDELHRQTEQLTYQLSRKQSQLQQLRLISSEKEQALESDLKALASYRQSLQEKELENAEKDMVILNVQDELKRSRAELTAERDLQKRSEDIINRLTDESGQLRRVLGSAEVALQVSHEEANILKGEIDRLKKIKKDFEARQAQFTETLEKNQELEVKLDLANAQIALKSKALKDVQRQLRQENEAALNREQELNIELRKARELKARKEIECKDLQDQKNRATEKMQMAISETNRQRQNSLSLVKKADAACKALQLQRQSLQIRDNELLECKKELTRYRIQKEQLARNLELLQSDYRLMQEKATVWEQKVSKMQRQQQSLQHQIETNRDQTRRLREQLAEAAETASEQKNVNGELMSANAEFARNEIEYVSKIEELERRIADIRNENQDYKPRYEALLQRNKELDQRNAELADMLNKAIEKHASEYKDRVLGDVARNAGNIYEHLKESVVLTNRKRRQPPPEPEPPASQNEHQNQPKTPPAPPKKQDPYKKLMSARISDHKRRISQSALKLVQLLEIDNKNPMDTYEDYQKINDRIESIEMQKSNLLSKINSYAEKLKIL